MALDRQRIERKDFPIGRRGYDPETVDAHLSALADEVDELKRSARRRTETLAATASEQVRAIVESAESSAAEIRRQAEDDAQEIRTEASSEARVTREQATAQARDYVGRVSESTAAMLERLQAMEAELGALIESLKSGGSRLTADLQLLERDLGEVRDAAVRPRFEPEGHMSRPSGAAPAPPAGHAARASASAPGAAPAGHAAATAPEAAELQHQLEGEEAHAQALEPAPGSAAAAAEETTAAGPEPAGSPAQAGLRNGDGDDESARFVALNMALSGSTREEVDRYLTENFHVRDQRGLLDEVYASVGG